MNILKWLRLGVLATSVLSLQGCWLKVIDWLTPTEGYTVQQHIAYGDKLRQHLDYYQPTTPNDSGLTVVFFYGGAWQSGDKASYRFVAQAFAHQGYSVVIPDYRVYPGVLFPKFIDDAALALKWVTDNTDQQLVLMGHSAGAHIAALATFNEDYLSVAGVEKDRIRALVGLSGAYDFLPLEEQIYKTIFSGADDLENTQPINFVDKDEPPVLLIHGLADKRVGLFNTENLAEKLKDKNNIVEVRLYDAVDHGQTVGSLSLPFRKHSPALVDILQFLSSL
ncbi:MAG: alpha/beta hydrolase [Pseudomonadota bacterium]